jgi:hypothetical protein
MDGLVLDEVAQLPGDLWSEVLRPALMDRGGWCTFIGTPKGTNLFSETYYEALRRPREWWAGLYTCYDTDALPAEEIEAAKRDMKESHFRREMLCDFAVEADDQLISMEAVRAAAGRTLMTEAYFRLPIVFGVDVARFGDDRSVLIVRQGPAILDMQSWDRNDLFELASKTAEAWRQYEPAAVFVDVNGVGAGVVDILVQLGYRAIGVDSSSKPTDPTYANLRAEMWHRMASWFDGEVSIPNNQRMFIDLTSPTYKYNLNNQILMERKEDLKKRGLPSPDFADALALTFAQDVHVQTDSPFAQPRSRGISGRQRHIKRRAA